MYFRKKTSGGRAYLQIVESRREGAAVRQQVIATLGEVEDLRESGQLERLLRSGARFAEKAIVLDALDRGEATTISTRRIGPALAFERVWEETGCRGVIERLAEQIAGIGSSRWSARRFLTRAASPVLWRGSGPRRRPLARRLSHRRGSRASATASSLYRAMALARGRAFPTDQQDGSATRRLRPRCVEGRRGGGSVAPCRRDLFLTHARHRVHGHHEPLFRGRGRRDARTARVLPRTIGPISIR